MKKVILCFSLLFACLSAMAFDFAGKTFKAQLRAGSTSMSQTVKFTSASKVEVTSARSQGAASVSDSKSGTWSLEGGNIVVTYDDGATTRYQVLELGGKVALIHSSWGEFVQVKSSAAKSKSGKGSGKSRRKKR